MNEQPVQAIYPDDIAVCYGCGRNNAHGLHIETYWNGAEGIARFTPQAHHTGFPGYTYGGLLASLIDCHAMATATAAAYHHEGRERGTEPLIMFVTGSLNVHYMKPTPIAVELVLRAWAKEIHTKKVIVECSIFAGEVETVRGEVIAIRSTRRISTEGYP